MTGRDVTPPAASPVSGFAVRVATTAATDMPVQGQADEVAGERGRRLLIERADLVGVAARRGG